MRNGENYTLRTLKYLRRSLKDLLLHLGDLYGADTRLEAGKKKCMQIFRNNFLGRTRTGLPCCFSLLFLLCFLPSSLSVFFLFNDAVSVIFVS